MSAPSSAPASLFADRGRRSWSRPRGFGIDAAEHQADALGARIGADLRPSNLSGPGPLPEAVRKVAERHLGVDLRGTHLRADGAAQRLTGAEGAVALTAGPVVSFASGELSSRSAWGRALLGHELTHVAQQRVGGTSGSRVQRRVVPEDVATEMVGRPFMVTQAVPTGTSIGTGVIAAGEHVVIVRWDNASDTVTVRYLATVRVPGFPEHFDAFGGRGAQEGTETEQRARSWRRALQRWPRPPRNRH